MATKKSTDEIARGADVPVALAAQTATRDALLDPQPGDIIPDVESKGYHVGEVRQPAEPVLKRSGDVTFESLPEAGESKFTSTYAEDFAKLDKALQGDPAYEGTLHVPTEADPDRAEAAYQARRAEAGPVRATGRRSSTGSDLASDANAVADKQAAEDRS